MTDLPPITSFNGQNRFLSNFYPAEVEYKGIIFPTSEHAYQAAKSNLFKVRYLIRDLKTPGEAKRRGRKIAIRNDWEFIKLSVMLEIIRNKFQIRNLTLGELLVNTAPKELVEGNKWHDTFWGQCPIGTGENYLGRILMLVREEMKDEL